ncbi:MAG: hypothetical protein QXQ53_08960 [Candidatus Methanosuratincola sp.]
MKLPHAEHAQIEARKIRDYLLSPTHPLGRFKAAFFRTLGYTQENWERLVQDLKEQHLVLDVKEVEETAYGRKYSIEGPLVGPNGRSALVVSVWIVEEGEEVPRFVTAYPA